MPADLWLIDAFADGPFSGNPAGVCVLKSARPEEWMLQVAREMNQAETAFLVPAKDGYNLRWFTPDVEMDLCGHATLASAHYLWAKRKLTARATARFHTKSGELTCKKKGEWIVMDFPAIDPGQPVEPPPYLLDAFRASGSQVYKGKWDYMIVLEKPAKVREVKPDFRLLAAIEARGVIITSPSDEPGVDFLSRFFAPNVGVPEDPVTGSAHCMLAPYWAQRLGRASLVGRQASKRSGIVQVEAKGDRVLLGGKAVTMVKGTIDL